MVDPGAELRQLMGLVFGQDAISDGEDRLSDLPAFVTLRSPARAAAALRALQAWQRLPDSELEQRLRAWEPAGWDDHPSARAWLDEVVLRLQGALEERGATQR